jgi:uncharacterized membrane protein YGL010W
MTQNDDGLLTRQFASYSNAHSERSNLLIHAFAVPLFVLGNATLLAAPFTSGWWAVAGALLSLGGFGLQGRGHGFEAERPAPFTGPLNALFRILAEQWITFPRFVLSGGFSRAWRRARAVPALGAEAS